MKTFLKLPYASTGKLIAIGKYFELISRNFRIKDELLLECNSILSNYYISGIISFLFAIVSINNNIVDAQWIETPPRYTCPTGGFIRLIFSDILFIFL